MFSFSTEKKLIFLLFCSLVLGVCTGMLLKLRPEPYLQLELMYLRLPGEILVNMLSVLSLPVVVSTLITSLTKLDRKVAKKLALFACIYFLVTTILATLLGILIAVIIQPGIGEDMYNGGSITISKLEILFAVIDLIKQSFPNNLIQMTFQKTTTKMQNSTGSNGMDEVAQMVPMDYTEQGINMLGVVTMSVVISLAINVMEPKGQVLKVLMEEVYELMARLIQAVLWYSPIGIFFLIVYKIVSLEKPDKLLKSLLYYLLTVLVALALHAFVVLPFIYMVVCRANPFSLMRAVLQAMITALSMASSLATLPVTLKNLEEHGLDPRVLRFVLPVGAILNMDGTALNDAVAVIFIAQVLDVTLGPNHIFILVLTSVVSSVSTVGIPQAGLMTMTMVLSAMELPAEGIYLILPMDWLLDHYRTAVNVLGDVFGAGILEHLCRREIKQMTQADEETSSGSLARLRYPENLRLQDPRHPVQKVQHHFASRAAVENHVTEQSSSCCQSLQVEPATNNQSMY